MIYKPIVHLRDVYEELGMPWEKFEEFLMIHHVDAMQSLHVETGMEVLYTYIYLAVILDTL